MALNKDILTINPLTLEVRDAKLIAYEQSSNLMVFVMLVLFMIELTAGVAFLMSSVYGSGQAGTQINKTSIDTVPDAKVITVENVRSFTDSKTVEKYVREQYLKTPVLVNIARCESNFRQYDEKGIVIRGRANTYDVGVMQINEIYHGDSAANLGYDIYSVEGNVAFGKYLYSKYGAQPWSASSKCWAGDLARK